MSSCSLKVFTALAALAWGLAAVVNKDVQRTVDATGSIVKITIDIKATNVEKEYQIAFPTYQAEHLAYLEVSFKGKAIRTSAPISQGNVTVYSVPISESSPALKVQAVFTGILDPYPAEIAQSDPQFVRFTDSHFFVSPYKTESQKTTVKLATSTVEAYTKLTPHSARGNTITFGPFKEVQPFSYSAATFHYMNNRPFAKFSTVNREVEVSHWGNIAIEEIYELQHYGAKLAGGFSRFDYMMKRNSFPTPSFRSLVATLPAQSNNIYYRDQIGNISTSSVRSTSSEVELEIETRFPMFGGWQTQFYIGYSTPTETALFVESETGRYNLKFDFFTIFEEVWVEDMEVKVVLPEGASDIKIEVPYEVETASSRRFTYLDSDLNGGRPVITLKARNIVEEHDKQIVISYTFSRPRMIVEPLILILTYFAFFVICSVLARVGGEAAAKSNKGSKDAAAAAAAAISIKKVD